MTTPAAPRRRATIKDVASAASVSRQTVSNVVNAPERVAPNTLERVQQVIDELGYRPSRAAKLLKQERAGAIGVEINSGGRSRLGSILDGMFVALTEQCRVLDSYVVPFATSDPADPISGYDDLVASRIVGAFVLTGTDYDDPRPNWLADNGIPFAAFGRLWGRPELTNWVDVDGAHGVSDAVQHLLANGYERIGWLGWPAGSPLGDERRAGWVGATTAAGVHDESLQQTTLQDVAAAHRAGAALVDQVGRGGAIVCASDVLAVGAWRAVVERGMTPGKDIGLVGFDDSELAQALGLSSLRQPVADVADHLLRMLTSPAATPTLAADPAPPGVLLTPTLELRASSTPG